MLRHYIHTQVDDDFGVVNSWGGFQSTSPVKTPEGILSISNNFATIDPNLFDKREFYKPVKDILNGDIQFSDISFEDFKKIMSSFGNYEIEDKDDRICLTFDPDNFYDLNYTFLEKREGDVTRMSITYKNCPVNSFYLLEDVMGNDLVKIIISPFTKGYYTISELEWNDFIKYLSNNTSKSESRDIKIREILNENPDKSFNLIRQAKFFSHKSSNRFVESILDFYEKRGYITDKQHKSIAKIIW